ncbi:MAG: VWA domain-containing protein [Proteobacteria bacterium]|nr:VWA domain-containing protein [Pseudomonadota bacterium]
MLEFLGFDRVTFVHEWFQHLSWLAIAVVALLWLLESRGRHVLGRFVSPLMQDRLATRLSIERRIVRLGLIFTALICGIVALMRPQTPGATETLSTGRISADIMVVLDVSRSMLADDAAPTRLDRAKAEVAEMASRLRGHRLGLVAFAGRAAVLAPLTPDYSFFRMILNGANTNSVSRGGTQIGTALRKAVASFDPGPGAKLILLITDGEDHDSYAQEAAKEALEAGIRVVAVGFGSEEGSKITLVDPDTGARSLLTDRNGTPVESRLDGELLREIALTTQGAYVPAGVAALDIEPIVRQHIKPLVRSPDEAAPVRTIPREHYSWFILAALISLLFAVAIGASPARSETL